MRLMYEFHCDYMESSYGSKTKLSYMDTNSFFLRQRQMIFTEALKNTQGEDLIQADIHEIKTDQCQQEKIRMLYT